MSYDELIEEIHTLLGRQAIGPPLCQQERERLDDCLKELNRLAAHESQGHIWIRSRSEAPQTKPSPTQAKAPVVRSGTGDFLRGMGAALMCIPLLCLIMLGCCVAGRWVAEQIVLPELPTMFAAACILPGAMLMWGAKGLAEWLDKTLLSYDEEDEI